MEAEALLLSQGALAIVVGFVVEGLKKAGMPSKWAMLVSAGLGLIVGLTAAYAQPELVWYTGAIGGILAGAVASGFYSGSKSMLAK